LGKIIPTTSTAEVFAGKMACEILGKKMNLVIGLDAIYGDFPEVPKWPGLVVTFFEPHEYLVPKHTEHSYSRNLMYRNHMMILPGET
jgi:hypothetical protein